ncbi:hypothetical protein [Paenibacillus sp. GCM10012306]|uniref:hypothetical protein n=1 Tax=Paenibacillus sp. GCM10012306 TaxID=3317342 RepID=UPI003614DDD2
MNLRRAALSMLLILSCVISSTTVSADWAFQFVVYNGSVYAHQGTYTPVETIGKKIGEVTFYSDREGTYSGNFSNTYPKGTPYYRILDISDSAVIAVQESDGRYATLLYHGKYAGKPDYTKPIMLFLISFVIIGYAAWLWGRKRRLQ